MIAYTPAHSLAEWWFAACRAGRHISSQHILSACPCTECVNIGTERHHFWTCTNKPQANASRWAPLERDNLLRHLIFYIIHRYFSVGLLDHLHQNYLKCFLKRRILSCRPSDSPEEEPSNLYFYRIPQEHYSCSSVEPLTSIRAASLNDNVVSQRWVS